jgi:hypothetical protein
MFMHQIMYLIVAASDETDYQFDLKRVILFLNSIIHYTTGTRFLYLEGTYIWRLCSQNIKLHRKTTISKLISLYLEMLLSKEIDF